MRAFVNRVVKILLSDQLVSALASMEMLWASETQGEIIDERLQLHGDYAFMLEYPIARLYTDCRVQRIYGGTSEIQKKIVARSFTANS